MVSLIGGESFCRLTSILKLGILFSMQPTLFSAEKWTVTRLTFYLRNLIESDPVLQDVWVSGEISNLSRPASGHVYFTLKDAGAALRCVMWRTSAARLKVQLQNGDAMEVHGKLGVYEVQGTYQLYVDQMQPVGEGALYQEFLRLKALLEADGLFEEARKRPLPEQIRRIGIVTSASGAALRDMLNTLRRRLPTVEVILAASPVQGVEAPPALVEALAALNRVGPDVILLARGGGSIEDLWAFNDERVVRAVAASRVPVICGVGHETDFTLSDFAADLRAPTPTAAAELATPITILDLQMFLAETARQLTLLAGDRLQAGTAELEALRAGLRYASPERRLRSERQRLDDSTRRVNSAFLHNLELQTIHVSGMERRMQALSPLAVLGRGYAVVTRESDGGVVTSTARAEQQMRVRVSDGAFRVRRITDNKE